MLGQDRCECLCIQTQSESSKVCGQDEECLVVCAGGSMGQVLKDLCLPSPEAPTPVVGRIKREDIPVILGALA